VSIFFAYTELGGSFVQIFYFVVRQDAVGERLLQILFEPELLQKFEHVSPTRKIAIPLGPLLP
jgi:hypothetical protein